MTKLTLKLAIPALALAMTSPAFASDCNYKKTAQNQTSVAGAYTTEAAGNIVDIAVATPQLSTLVAAVKAADLVDALSADGPLTVFAPTNSAFADLPAGTVDTLLKPENKAQLSRILTSHVVAGNLSGADIVAKVELNGGKAYVRTLSGAKLKIRKYGDTLYIKDEKGGVSYVRAADVATANGTVHIIDGVLLPGDHNAS